MPWFNKNLQLEDLNTLSKNTLGEHLGMEFIAIGEGSLTATMPVNNRTKQPFGLLHGGASAALAETLGSVASYCLVDPEKYNCVGLEINANHLRSATKGFVTGTCSPIRIGRTIHVWNIEIKDERGKLVCISRLTVMVIKKP